MSNFLSAAWGADTPTAPIWLMRQAGRCLPEYRKLKERYGFWRMCRTPEIAAEITLQPARRFPLDAAILFNDIMTPLPPMGVDIDFDPGPVIREPVRTPEAVRRLRVPTGEEVAPFVADAVRLVRQECTVPLIGFAGAPLTPAAYLVQGRGGSANYPEFRGWLRWSAWTGGALGAARHVARYRRAAGGHRASIRPVSRRGDRQHSWARSDAMTGSQTNASRIRAFECHHPVRDVVGVPGGRPARPGPARGGHGRGRGPAGAGSQPRRGGARQL